MDDNRVIVGISGASGAIYGLRCLDALRAAGVETHLVVSRAGEMTLRSECGLSLREAEQRCDHLHAIGNVGATIASGSFRTRGMIVAPCTVKTLSAIANSFTYNLVVRAADVQLKEGRKLVLMVRETPLHKGHLELMTRAADCGAMILPPMPAFYHRPKTIMDLIHQSLGKALDQVGIEHDLFARWNGHGPDAQPREALRAV